MSAVLPTPSDDGGPPKQGRVAVASKTSFGVLSHQKFRSKETKTILQKFQEMQKWSKFSQRWLFHAPRNPVGFYTNAKIDEIIANLSFLMCVLANVSVLGACAVDDYRRRQKQAGVDFKLAGLGFGVWGFGLWSLVLGIGGL